MACCDPTQSKSRGGSCGCGDRPFPWFSAVTDPAIRRLFLRRYRTDLAFGAGAGAVVGLGVLGWSESFGALGPLLGGPWLRLRLVPALPAALLAGMALALTLAVRGVRGWRLASGWMLVFLALGGLANGFLELEEGSAGFLRGGGWVSLLAYLVLGLPALWLAWWVLVTVFRKRRPGPRAVAEPACD
jgi:hypothetical protein